MTKEELDFCRRLARSIAGQFGKSCEVAVYDLETGDPEHSIVAIENGVVSGRKIGSGLSGMLLEAVRENPDLPNDPAAFLTRTKDGRVIRSSAVCIRNPQGQATGILSISFDVTLLLALRENLRTVTETDADSSERSRNPDTVSHLFEDLIRRSIELVGKPVSLMTKEDKVKAVRYLYDSGALLVSKSGPRICEVFGFSKYTLYNYLEEIEQKRSSPASE